jgi:hypothetical protein
MAALRDFLSRLDLDRLRRDKHVEHSRDDKFKPALDH